MSDGRPLEGVEPGAGAALDAILDRVDATLDRVDGAFPYYADPETGVWETTPDGDWCGGHWAGLLWLATARADGGDERERYAAAARRYAERAAAEMPSNTMFRGLTTTYAGFRGYDVTGDRALFGMGLSGADDMLALYDGRARQVPLGEFALRGPDNFRGPEASGEPPGRLIGAVDNVYTAVPALWRAYEATGDPRFRDTAVSHVDRHLDWYVRPDGSTWHHAVFDGDDGSLRRQYNELAHSDETCWARGQGWNVAGLAAAYDATGAERYLDALERTVDYYVDNSPADLVPYWDFAAPGIPDEPRDTSAAALVAYGLGGLDGDDDRVATLRRLGERVLASVVDGYLVVDPGSGRHGMVTETCFNKPGEYATDVGAVWTEFYVACALDDYLR